VSIATEQEHVTTAYAHLRDLIRHLEERMAATSQAPATGTGQDILEREALLEHLFTQVRAARAAEQRLCFGAIVTDTKETSHIGRIGLRDAAGDPLLLDWRAPGAAPFYQATAADSMGVRTRRRIATQGETVTHVEDEDLNDVLAVTSAATAAVETPREGRMADIVATIAADQDRIIRSPLEQITVVEGGPGTGKTVVALHRAAWLLYTYRERLAKDGVLIIGPSEAFLHYIDQVLPSLGETDVVLLTPGQLYPPVSTNRIDTDETAQIKGNVIMAGVIRRAVSLRQRLPKSDLHITLEDGSSVTLRAADIKAAAHQVPKGLSFHAGREPFLRRLMSVLTTQRLRNLQHDVTDDEARTSTMADLAADVNVRRALNLIWLPVTPEQLIGRLLSDESFLAEASSGVLSNDERGLLLREDATAWTTDDVPLLDEAAELLGPWDPAAAHRLRREHADRSRELAAAARAVETFGGWVSAQHLVDRDTPTYQLRSVAERAMEDREWIYGHVVVDEAQDLSAMAWRVVQRRCSRRSATIVGDLQQAAHPAAPRTWNDALAWAKGRVEVQRLTITYRITKQTVTAAIDALVRAGGVAPHIEAVRDGAEPLMMSSSNVVATVLDVMPPGDGRAAVIVPDDRPDLAIELAAADPRIQVGPAGLDFPIAVLTVAQTKGLEFDEVLIVDPERIASQRPRGADIYVAATRPTQRLILLDVEAAS